MGVLTDYNDWGNIDLFFGRNFSGDANLEPGGITLHPDVVGDDRQPVAVEKPIPQSLLDFIQGLP